ncbi:hypothetical protein M2281_000649 [Mesorhizobium soli]|uniref:hypothetical protein n=1 Tax=Pseudaminobacter soli (ex Li et al. 2025) TaxID=1295366 RepID=UPI0024754DE7|nr:hypothetical protein [Mesorhizobium soli]MDH6230077.1 hypothetical protein [Mesorhizobium soli]
MGSILSFVPRKAASRPIEPPAQALASIIIFPGVRYERRAMIEATGVSTIIGRPGAGPKKPTPRH